MSCLFNSISKLLENELNVINVKDLRKFICNYMENNLESILRNDKLKDWLESISLDKYNYIDINRYINDMKNNITWGGAPEIALVSKIFKVKIIVVDRTNKSNLIEFNNSDDKVYKKLFLEWTGGHYEPIKIENINLINFIKIN